VRLPTRVGIFVVAALFVAGTAWGDGEYEIDWSATFEARLKDFQSPEDDDDVTGFFDQYEFTRNKDKQPTIDLALSEFALDLLESGEETLTPRLQIRMRSPTSNLNVSGQSFSIGEYFLNQRAELYARPKGMALDVDYRRFRTDDLRLFNEAGWNLDFTAPDDRFFVRRTGVGGELRIRPQELLTGERGALGNLLSEIALRGGYEERKGKRHTRNQLQSRTSELDQEVTDAGAGLVFNPGGLFTLAVDFDHDRFREDAGETINFIPDTGRTTGTVRLNTRLGERAVLHGGLQMSTLDQEGTRTAAQKATGLRSNKVLFYSGNLATDIWLAEDVSLNAFFKFDQRRNRMEKEPGLFDPSDGTQVGPFLKRVRRIVSGSEAVYRLAAMNRLALGVRGEWIDRTLEFPDVCRNLPGATRGICPDWTMIDDETNTFTFYLRTSLRPRPGIQLSGEVGYAETPHAGYIRDRDDMSYGTVRASYTFPLERPLTLSLFGRGEFGDNDDFTQLAPDGTTADRKFDRDNYSVGGTLTGSPRDGLTLFGSLYFYDDEQDFDLIFSSPSTRFTFASGGGSFLSPPPPFPPAPGDPSALDYRAENTALILGGNLQLTERTDASLSYSFTRSNWRFQSDTPTTALIADDSRIRSDIHSAEVGVGHWLRDGLRLSAGYRWDYYRDRTPTSRPVGANSAAPFNLSTRQHTVTLGITLNDDLLR
jgi:hypothetical protein